MLQFSKMTRFILNRSTSVLIKNDDITQYVKYNFLQHQKILFLSYMDYVEDEIKKPKKKTQRIPQITLLYPDDSTTVTTLEAAERLAKRRNFNLIKVVERDPKSNRAVYKLQSSNSYKFGEEFQVNEVNTHFMKYKSTKSHIIKNKISEHDLNIKIKNINKALSKMHMVKVVLTDFQDSNLTNMIKHIQQNVEGYKKHEAIKQGFTVLMFQPLLNDENNSLDENIDNIKNNIDNTIKP